MSPQIPSSEPGIGSRAITVGHFIYLLDTSVMEILTIVNHYWYHCYVLTFKRVNSLLTLAIIAVNLYVLGLPMQPQLQWWINRWFSSRERALAAHTSVPAEQTGSITAPQPPMDNRLIIPSLSLEQPIHEGDSAATLRKGIWHLPHTSTPEHGSNTTLVGHRFSYKDPAVFYHLDKLQIGDQIAIYWHQQHYIYEVSSSNVVEPNDSKIENPTSESVLTLYTCTPLWSARDRLVITAKQVFPS